jgi:signal transduction histidine kinase
VLLYFNILIVCGLLVLLVSEQRRARRFKRTVEQTRTELLHMAHEMRTPLGMLQKYSVFLQNKEFGQLSFAQQEALSKAQSALGNSLLLLNTLFARMRIGEGGIPIEPIRLGVRQAVEAAISAVRAAVKSGGTVFKVIGGKDAWAVVDPLFLHGIIDELLLNAAYYSPSGSTVEVRIQESPKQVRITITDKGIGISKAEAPHIFEKFFRGEQARKMHAGNGLGLAFAKEFSSRIGGSLSFAPGPKKGSAFTVVLPKG